MYQGTRRCICIIGGSGSELVLCKELKRNFISCELHPEYYQMILDRLKNKGEINEKHRLEFIQDRNKNLQQKLGF